MGRRLLAACLLGFVLVILSGVLHMAVAAHFAGGWGYAWATWAIAGLLAALIAFGARTERDAWAWLCFVNAVVSIGILAALLMAALAGPVATPPTPAPLPAALPAPEGSTAGALRLAIASGLLGLVVTILAAGFLLAAYVLMRGRARAPDR